MGRQSEEPDVTLQPSAARPPAYVGPSGDESGARESGARESGAYGVDSHEADTHRADARRPGVYERATFQPGSSGERSLLGRTVHLGEFGLRHWARGVVRRRLGLRWFQLLHPRVRLGRLCDIRPPTSFLVAPGASARFGAGCVLDSGIVVESRGTLIVGPGTVFGHHCTLAVSESVEIGADCLIGELVSIRDHDHAFDDEGIPILAQGRRTSRVRIGHNVWLGCKVTVTSGVTIGDNTIVGANAVVTGDLPANCIALGIPARVVRIRN
jgi:acetyltransferase-like isoleucine patch superfamily enzyme